MQIITSVLLTAPRMQRDGGLFIEQQQTLVATAVGFPRCAGAG